MQCLAFNYREILIYSFCKLLNRKWINVAVGFVINETLRVVLVLDLHLCELADVDVVSEVSASSHALTDGHVHVEGFVGLVLAVADAEQLGGGGGRSELKFHAVLVALVK